jgi:hypothetical protein
MLVSAFNAYRRTDLVEARRLATAILETGSEVDPWSSVDAEHIMARAYYDERNLTEAEATLLRILTRSEQLGYSEGFVRALHEISRVKAQKYEPLDAEAGFRVALEYYSLRALALRRSGGMDAAHDSEVRNVQSALNCLSTLAETYFLLSNGPTEGSRLLQGLCSDFFADDQTGDDFLEIRGLALRLLTKEAREYHATNLIGRAMALFPKHRPLSMYAFDEAAWHGERRGIAYPARLRQIYSRSAGRSLRDSSSFKPNARIETTQHPLRHTSPDDAAETIGALYDYLIPLDREGRYVYRGQVKEYDAPLLPSAFRAILTESHGATALPWSSFPSTSRLRDCGESFVGDYNYCFSSYADVTSIGGGHRMDQAAQERVASIYHKLLNDLSLILAQQREGFLSWADAVRSVLPESDLEVYRSNAGEWNVRIDNYHRRTFRNELLVRLFGYTLGTTFAQQFGLSSEGLDATQSLSVACFFATHHSLDFLTMADAGVGVIYRFPFPANDVAARPLSAFNFYNLPSIIDVEDVFYRFEHEELDLEDGIACMRGYLTAALTYHVESLGILRLPRGFMASSRVQRQQAVIILPDEIREDLTDRDPGIDGIRFPKYRYVENLKARPGVQRFYFRHTGRWPDSIPRFTREELWPRDDFLLETLVLLAAASYRLRQAIPKRLDLIEGGYAPEEFLSYLKTLYDRYRFSFVTPQEGLAPVALVM